MTRAPVALCLAFVVSDLRTAMAEPCARAELSGDAAAVERVRAELARLGVVTGKPAPGCSSIEAVVELDRDGGLAVAIRAAGRSEGRAVSDAAMAAAWIESWVRDDVEWTPATPPRVAQAAEPPPAAPGTFEVRDDVHDAPLLERFAFAAAYELGWTDDGSSWSGATVAACTSLGPLCIGGRVRASFQPLVAYQLATASRTDVSVLATAALPLTLGRMSISPEVGLGAGRLDTSRVEACTPPVMCPDPTDPMCAMPPSCGTDPSTGGKVYVGDHLHVASYTPRIAAALRIAVPLFDHVWLEGIASVALAPFGHTDPYPPGTMVMPPPGTADQLALPGEPTAAVQLGVGLRVGGR